MLRSSFSSFTTAQLAIRANQNALAVVGQNMSNVNTTGYTRQRLDQVSFNLTGRSSTYPGGPDAQIGYGVKITGLSQIRDPFLDVRYRTEMANVGTEDKKHTVLEKLNGVLDELDRDGALDDQFSDLFKQLTSMTSNANKDDTLVRSSAKTLTDMIRKYASQLDDIQDNLVTTTQDDVTNINQLLDNIQKLNTNIKSSQVHGNDALELQDERNQLIDELSTYMNIDVQYTTEFTLTGNKVDVLQINMLTDEGQKINLINDIQKAAQLSFTEAKAEGEQYSISVTDTKSRTYSEVTSDKGVFKSALEMLNGYGEYDTSGTAQGSATGIGYYQKSLDALAQKLAETFNNTNYMRNEDGVILDDNGDPIQVNGVDVKDAKDLPAGKKVLGGGNLFESDPPGSKITASNISLSNDWISGAVHLIPSQNPNAPSGDFSNIDNLKNLLSQEKLTYTSDNGSTVFKGTFQEFFSNIASVAATELKSCDTALANYVSVSNDVANSKDSVSGVNVDEEVMNMMQFNNALNAASRLMTTLDEALSTIITSMGVVGR